MLGLDGVLPKMESKRSLIKGLSYGNQNDSIYLYQNETLIGGEASYLLSIAKSFPQINDDSLILRGEYIKDIYLKRDTIYVISSGEVEIYDKRMPINIIERK